MVANLGTKAWSLIVTSLIVTI